jgi:glycosyltransferase involved in cell wall biosynthesis
VAVVPLTVIIPAHRRVKKLLHTLKVVFACSPEPDEVIVHVDGGSQEVMGEVSSLFPQVKLLASESLLGPGGSRDRMIRMAKHEWVVTFDDDSYPESPGFFARVMADIERFPEAAVLSWDTLSDEKAAAGFHHIAVFSGCGSVFNRPWYLRTKGFVPRVVAYGFEEVDVSVQLHCLGGRVIYDPCLRVVHDHPMPDVLPREIVAGAVVNAFLFPLSRYPLVLLPWAGLAGLRYTIRVLLKGEASAVWQALRQLPGEVWNILRLRTPLPLTGVLGWLKLRRHPQALGLKTDSS